MKMQLCALQSAAAIELSGNTGTFTNQPCPLYVFTNTSLSRLCTFAAAHIKLCRSCVKIHIFTNWQPSLKYRYNFVNNTCKTIKQTINIALLRIHGRQVS